MFEVDGYSQSDESFTLNWTKGGYQECRGSSHGGAFFIENVFEELDAPGEYFYDRKAKQLFLYPNGTISEMKRIRIAQHEKLIEVSLPSKIESRFVEMSMLLLRI